ncbi:MAG: YlqD family protein [Hormoscilla sp. GM102CHS1]|nr:YlqD family protein [Hormoscilla sp. GM102CHS1]
MEDSKTSLMLKRQVQVKAIVTPRWKEETQQQLQNQINQIDNQLQQMEMQGQQAIEQVQQQNIQPLSDQANQQIQNIQGQVNQKKNQLLQQKNQILQQLNRLQTLELEQEVSEGQIDSFFQIEKGQNIIEKMRVEIVLRDGSVEEIRGEL